ncbi:tryptophan synthase subunit alpha [Denitrobacterium detoxificans]|uniref:Tryptophan synthase alpha chain n=1 Tax=Denitrobacterium detoxificans TaxID=79604 RepID=A0A172RWM4_9ACTN|nr:tryptophan synthase subunit alpha [Denitrobacterium detoxificans]ANE22128.1 tryptophan synthase subunit alpha [Denitrobacterium detoxificans]SEO84822.1 tryptophan synthase, alpha chain [Denitrobacterium detoxificans]
MSNIARAFQDGKAFIPFITAGDPSVAVTEECIRAMARAGADLIEIGIPFSDPTAEGPVIMAANERALAGGVTTDDVFAMVARLREGEGGPAVRVPFVFMTYANVVFSYGVERFMERAAQAGVDGLILPDVPFEERGEFADPAQQCGLDLVSMVAPTSKDRIRTIAREASGFVYVVSSLGVTGMRSEITTDVGELVSHIREVSDVPAAIGFGISTPEQARSMAQVADGAIVGSAIMKIVAARGAQAPVEVEAYVSRMAQAVHGASDATPGV